MQIKKHSLIIKKKKKMKKKMEKKWPTTPGIPKRSPIQVLTRPDVD